MSLLECLLCASEKAANIARKCRREKQLFELLVEEKKSGEANPRFVQDFKTLADVLIQQTVKHDVGNVFPELRENIRGEESNVFSNKLGESIIVDVLDNVEITGILLETVLNGNTTASALLAEEVHKVIQLKDINTKIPDNNEFNDLDYSQLGVWIDPIDSTAEYISGTESIENDGIYSNGLKCVTVLIGVYNRKTGEPIMGVVNQPFYTLQEHGWKGKCYWGYSINDKKGNSIVSHGPKKNIISLSSSEDEEIKTKLRNANFKLIDAAGAGYKLLTVIQGKATSYVLSKNSTFKWDTCGPQAILRALGGDIIVFKDSNKEIHVPLRYFDNEGCLKIEKCCNEGGLIAYISSEDVNAVLEALKA